MDDRSVRQATFAWLDEQTGVHGYSLDRTLLAKGFGFQGEQIRLVGPQGIFKPKCLELPLSITTVAGGPYTDSFRPDGLLSYRYRGTDPQHRDNIGLRNCLRQRKPLVYLHGIERGTYVPAWPVFIVGDEERACRLKHGMLLDAAHIVPDSDPEGEPVTSNGISLCKLHHAAFDKHFLAIRPDYVVEIRRDLLEETDGPMLKHGLQGLHHQTIVLPLREDQKPNKLALERRYQRFKAVLSES